MLVLVDTLNERCQIEIIFAEQNADRLDGAYPGLAIMGAAVGDLHQVVVFHRRSDLPQALDELAPVLRFDVMESLVADEVFDLIQPVKRCTGQNQLVQNREHFLLDHGAAFQQNLAYCQNLTAGEKSRKRVIQQIATLSRIIQNLPARLAVCKMIAQGIKVALDGFLTDTEAVSRLLLIHHTALHQHLLNIEYTVQSTITHGSFSFSFHCNTVQQALQFFVWNFVASLKSKNVFVSFAQFQYTKRDGQADCPSL